MRHARSIRGWSQEELAARTGLSYQDVRLIEWGTARPSVQTLGLIAEHLNLLLPRLLEWAGAFYVNRMPAEVDLLISQRKLPPMFITVVDPSK